MKKILILFLCLQATLCLYAQITGSQNVNVGNQVSYSYTGFAVIPEWQAVNGNVISSSSSGATFYATIEWTTVGSGSVTFLDNGGLLASLPITINAAQPQAPTPNPGSRCGAGTVTLSATPGANGDNIKWYTAITRGTFLGQGLTYVTPSLSASTTYYISTVNTSTNAESSPRISITATVHPAVGNPASLTGASRCGAGLITLSGSPGSNANSLNWYTQASGGSIIHTGSSYSPTLSVSTTYYVGSVQTATGCESARLTVTATIQVLPSQPSVTSAIRCGSGTVTLGANAGSNTARWYDSPTGGTLLATGASYTPSVATTTTYYVSAYSSNGCESDRVPVTGTVLPIPAAPVPLQSYFGRYGFGSITLSASGLPANATWQWTTDAGVPINGATSATYTNDYAATTSYRVKVISSNGCESPSTLFTGHVLPMPIISNASSTYLAANQTVTLTAQTGYASYQWKREGALIPGATTHTYVANASGRYTVAVTLPNGSAQESPHAYVAQLTNAPEAVAVTYDNNPPPSVSTASRKNFVRSYTAKKPGLTVADFSVTAFDKTEISATTQYLDGLGMPIQTTDKQASPQGKDMVIHSEYDAWGREVKKYLPFSTLSADVDVDGFRKNAKLEQYQFYRNGTPEVAVTGVPFSETAYEASPLNRVMREAGPGEAWKMGSGHETKIDSRALGSQDAPVRIFTISSSGQLVQTASFYALRDLAVTDIRDENDATVREYKDKEGRLILRRMKGDGAEWLDTYYVSDLMGNLRFVLPPLLHQRAYPYPTASIDSLAYQYVYDSRQRPIEKRIPGGGWVYVIYDALDRPVLTQDAVQRATNKWSFVKYDVFNRPVLTGETTNATAYATLRATISAQAANESKNATHQYTLNSAPPTVLATEVLTQTFYDNYLLPSPFVTASTHAYVRETTLTQGTGHPDTFNKRVRGQVTATLVRNLDTQSWLESIIYYDDRYRPIQTLTLNIRNGRDRVSMAYENAISPQVLRTISRHNVGSGQVTLEERIDYDDFDRPLTVYHKTAALTEIRLANHRYNELGQTVEKNLHSASGTRWLQSLDMAYHIQGTLKAINHPALTGGELSDQFGMELFYENGYQQKQYNGNIAGMRWKTARTGQEHSYGYVYDPLNRLRVAEYTRKNGPTGAWDQDVNRFTEIIKGYDANGNILGIDRKGLISGPQTFGQIDHLNYTYQGNQLLKVHDVSGVAAGFKDDGTASSDPAPDYAYNANGNLTKDDNKLISTIEYNYLNLPRRVTKTNGEYVKYIYNALGVKLRQEVYNASHVLQKSTDYAGPVVYENNVLLFINHAEGRVVKTGTTTWQYQYHLKDHLGNVRMTIAPKKDVFAATFETATNTDFSNYTRVNLDLFDRTDAGTAFTYSQRLTGGVNSQVGLAKSLAVNAGDTVTVEVWAKYLGTTGSGGNLANFAGALLSAFGLPAPTGGETGTAAAAINNYGAFIAGGGNPANSTWPRGFLNVLVFDKNYVLIDAAWQQLDGSFVQPVGSSVKQPHQKLERQVLIFQPGFVYIYVSNEGNVQQDIHFDDLKLTHAQVHLVQEEAYYAFGMAHSSYQNPAALMNNNLYNGKERQDELDLGWLDYGARMYDNAIGRWHALDPLAEQMRRWSPYAYAFDNPIIFTDPDGMAPTKYGVTAGSAETGSVDRYGAIQSEIKFGNETFDSFESLFAAHPELKGVVVDNRGGVVVPNPNFFNMMNAFIEALHLLSSSGGSGTDEDQQTQGEGPWGKGSVPYNGKALGGTNFIGPSEDFDPRTSGMKPIDEIDLGAYYHDINYYDNKTGGIYGALLNQKVKGADLALALAAKSIIERYLSGNNNIDKVTGLPLSERTFNLALGVWNVFAPITEMKYLRDGYVPGGLYNPPATPPAPHFFSLMLLPFFVP